MMPTDVTALDLGSSSGGTGVDGWGSLGDAGSPSLTAEQLMQGAWRTFRQCMPHASRGGPPPFLPFTGPGGVAAGAGVGGSTGGALAGQATTPGPTPGTPGAGLGAGGGEQVGAGLGSPTGAAGAQGGPAQQAQPAAAVAQRLKGARWDHQRAAALQLAGPGPFAGPARLGAPGESRAAAAAVASGAAPLLDAVSGLRLPSNWGGWAYESADGAFATVEFDHVASEGAGGAGGVGAGGAASSRSSASQPGSVCFLLRRAWLAACPVTGAPWKRVKRSGDAAEAEGAGAGAGAQAAALAW